MMHSSGKIRNLGDIASFINGFAFKPEDWTDEGLPIIRIQDLTGSSYQTNRYSGSCDKRYEVNSGDVLISWSASLGIYVWSGEKAVLNQHIFKVVFDKETVNKSFFIHQVRHILENATEQAHGATMKHLTRPVFNALPFRLPDAIKQKEIADILDSISNMIELRQKILSKLDQLAKSRFIEMFGTEYDGKYPYVPITAISDEIFAGGDVPEDHTKQADEKHPIPIYSNGIERDGLYGFAATARVTKPSLTVSARGTIGCIFTRVHPFIPIIRLIVITPDLRKTNLTYLSYALRGKFVSKTGSSIPQLPVPLVKTAKVILPPLALQNEFAAFIEQLDKSKLAKVEVAA